MRACRRLRSLWGEGGGESLSLDFQIVAIVVIVPIVIVE